jgi:histidinol phosphatase-like enzyme
VRKPNPALFLHALRGVSVAPEEAAMVGDSLRMPVKRRTEKHTVHIDNVNRIFTALLTRP